LRKAGISVCVYERDQTRDDWLQAYRIHIRDSGCMALQICLPPAVWDSFLACAGVPPAGLSFVDERLTELASIRDDAVGDAGPAGRSEPARMGYPISRVTLRNVLLLGLEDAVHFSKTFERYEQMPDGRVRAFFSDGTSADGDLLVGADGVRSHVRRQLLPSAKVVDTGVLSLAGQYPLTEQSRGRLPRRFVERMTVVFPRSGFGMFIAQFVHGPYAGVDAADPDTMRDHVFWGIAARPQRYGAVEDARRMNQEEQLRLAARIVRPCHPALRRLVEESDPRTVIAPRILTSDPVQAWETTNVTLLGDAIHMMTPFQGLGGNTALRDASLLTSVLTDVAGGRGELLPSMHAYESAMLAYGFGAVKQSLRATRFSVSDNVVARSVFRTALRAVNAFPPLKSHFLAA
jgi:2-polyprenyl-6-methoxyphenol hydroxylase-like FAD-dependent oxidoreductase